MRIRRPAALAAGLLVVAFPALPVAPSPAGRGRRHCEAAGDCRLLTPARLQAAIPRDFVRDAKGFHLEPQKGSRAAAVGGGEGDGLSTLRRVVD
jgi:hypothetical protein